MKAFALVMMILAAGVTASAASADGLPVLGVDTGPAGVTVPGADARYVALPAPRGTLVARIGVEGGQILGFRYLRGRYTVPAVAYDGTTAGLSADARTLVLLEPRATFPRQRTRLRILEAPTLRTRTLVTLRGDYSFDAISPDGTWLYLIQYVSPKDPTRYRVRAYDLEHGRLVAQPVVDPRERGEAMRGNPITRAASADGRWAYTLYDGAGGHPFVHALDTVGRTARCIDLHELAGRDLGAARLAVDGSTLAVRLRGRAVSLIDTETFAVTVPRPEPAPTSPRSDDALPWGALGIAGFVALAGVGIASFSALRYRATA